MTPATVPSPAWIPTARSRQTAGQSAARRVVRLAARAVAGSWLLAACAGPGTGPGAADRPPASPVGGGPAGAEPAVTGPAAPAQHAGASPSRAAPPPATAPPSSAPPAAAPPPILAYDQAVLGAATALLNQARALLAADPAAPARRTVVIDPLIDGLTGQQSTATRDLGARLAALIRSQYPPFELLPFSAANVASSPLVLIGTFTGVNAQRQSSGPRQAYRICLALADLKTGKLVGKGLAFARPDGVDPTPLASYRDAPAWAEDPTTQAYVRTCQGTRAGDPINPLYVDRILTAALVAEAMEAYDQGRYPQALQLFESARRTPAGDQFRVHNGLYLAHARLGQRTQAEAAFAQLVDFGLGQQRLAVKFLFRPGSTAFPADARLTAPYPMWLKTIGQRSAQRQACLELVGHTSATGPEPLNERLSQLRADALKSQLQAQVPAMAPRIITRGMGSREMLVGNGRDDASDVLDRRVEFKVIGC